VLDEPGLALLSGVAAGLPAEALGDGAVVAGADAPGSVEGFGARAAPHPASSPARSIVTAARAIER
jgi:hypothetical protein